MKELIKKISGFLKILSDKKNLEILLYLKSGEKSSVEIQRALKLRQPTVSLHIKILMDENLVFSSKKDNIKYYNIQDDFLFKVLSSVHSLMVNLKRDEIQSITDLSIFDTLI